MRLHVERIKDHLQSQNIETITWTSTDKMLADPLTKIKADTTNLITVLKTGKWEKPT